MRKYKITILDRDTMIERTIEIQAGTAKEAHKAAIWSLNDLEVEEIAAIRDDSKTLLYSSGKGFIDISHNQHNY